MELYQFIFLDEKRTDDNQGIRSVRVAETFLRCFLICYSASAGYQRVINISVVRSLVEKLAYQSMKFLHRGSMLLAKIDLPGAYEFYTRDLEVSESPLA